MTTPTSQPQPEATKPPKPCDTCAAPHTNDIKTLLPWCMTCYVRPGDKPSKWKAIAS